MTFHAKQASAAAGRRVAFAGKGKAPLRADGGSPRESSGGGSEKRIEPPLLRKGPLRCLSISPTWHRGEVGNQLGTIPAKHAPTTAPTDAEARAESGPRPTRNPRRR